MVELAIVGYIMVSTYYFIGILFDYAKIVRKDHKLRHFLRKCPPANVFAVVLIMVASYSWPIMLPLQMMIKYNYEEKTK
jgi:hypothetical protein